MEMVKIRNEAVYTYKEELAESLYKKLPKFLELFENLKEKVK